MPLIYREPSKWENKKDIKILNWNAQEKEKINKIIDEIPEGAEAKIIFQEQGKRKKEYACPYMGNWEYEIFKKIIDETAEYALVELKIFWNPKKDILKEMEESAMKRSKRKFFFLR